VAYVGKVTCISPGYVYFNIIGWYKFFYSDNVVRNSAGIVDRLSTFDMTTISFYIPLFENSSIVQIVHWLVQLFSFSQ
jgi:hypothetical protein